MIEVTNLVKWYGPTLAVDHLSFEIPAGQIVGFLGPNGAGKSTTLRMITGYLPPTLGKATVAGFDVTTQSQQARAKLGYLPESTPLYPELRVEEHLHFHGKLQGMDRALRNRRINEVCDRCGLTYVRRRLVGQLSKGNKQRVGLAQALLHEPPVLILDEPTAGLDPNQIQNVRELIRDLRGKHTILLSTHILSEIERIADRVLIIANGQIKFDKPVEQRMRLNVEVKANLEAVKRVVGQIKGVSEVDGQAMTDGWCQLTVTPDDNKDVSESIGQVMLTNGFAIRQLGKQTASLEQHFREVTAPTAANAAPDSAA